MTSGNSTKPSITGYWNLLAMEQRYDDGRVLFPFGRDVQGRLYYGDDGTMFCAIQKSGRTPFRTGKQWTASDAEKARAYDDYLSYAGRYEIVANQVIHHVEISLYPDWIGIQQVRELQFDGDCLQLAAKLESNTPEARTS